MPHRALVVIWVALAALVPIGAYMANGVVLVLILAAGAAPGPRALTVWGRRRLTGLTTASILGLLIWLTITASFAIDPGEAAMKGLRLFAVFGLTLLALAGADEGTRDTARREGLALAIALTALILVVAVEYVSGGLILKLFKDYPRELVVRGLDMTLSDYTSWRVRMTLGRSAILLVALAPVAMVAIAGTRLGRRGAALFGVAALALILILPIATAKIAALAGLGAAAVAWRAPRLAIWTLVAALIIALIIAPPLALRIDPAAPFGLDPLTLDPSLQHRFHIWRFTAERIAERPWFGWGLESARAMPGGDQWVAVFRNGVPMTSHTAALPLHPHDAFLHVWLEGGALAALALGGAFLGIGQVLDRLRADRVLVTAAVAATAGLSVIASASFGLWQDWWLAVLALSAVFITACARARRPDPAPGRASGRPAAP